MRLAWLALLALALGVGLTCHSIFTRVTVLVDCRLVGEVPDQKGQLFSAYRCNSGFLMMSPTGEKKPTEIGV